MSVNEDSRVDPVTGLSSADLLEILHESADEVFSTMIGLVGVLLDQTLEGESISLTESSAEEIVYEAVVGFSGLRTGAVILKAGHGGALDIARGLLMLAEDEEVEAEEIEDALGECANMLSGSLKRKALDPTGGFHLGTPQIGQTVAVEHDTQLGGLVYELSQGCISVEVWMDEEDEGA